MSDSLANGEGDATPEQAHLYQRWVRIMSTRLLQTLRLL